MGSNASELIVWLTDDAYERVFGVSNLVTYPVTRTDYTGVNKEAPTVVNANKYRWSSFWHYFRIWTTAHQVGSDTDVLDVGCGYGDVAVFLQSHRMNCRYVGLDIDRAKLKVACERQSYGYPTLFVLRDLARPLPFAGGRFQTVVCTEVLEHLSEAEVDALLVEMGRVLVEGGRLIVSVPFPLSSGVPQTRYHLSERPPDEVFTYLERGGFEVVDSFSLQTTLGNIASVVGKQAAEAWKKRVPPEVVAAIVSPSLGFESSKRGMFICRKGSR